MPFENPFFIILLGSLATLVPFLLWCNLGGGKLLLTTTLCFAFFAGWLALERSVETDRESIQRTVYELRDLMRKNDVDGLLRRTESPELRDAIERLRGVTVSSCSVSNLSNSPEFQQQDGETFGVIQFIGAASVTTYGRVGPVKVKLDFRKVADGDWRIVKFQYQLLGDKTNAWSERLPQ